MRMNKQLYICNIAEECTVYKKVNKIHNTNGYDSCPHELPHDFNEYSCDCEEGCDFAKEHLNEITFVQCVIINKEWDD